VRSVSGDVDDLSPVIVECAIGRVVIVFQFVVDGLLVGEGVSGGCSVLQCDWYVVCVGIGLVSVWLLHQGPVGCRLGCIYPRRGFDGVVEEWVVEEGQVGGWEGDELIYGLRGVGGGEVGGVEEGGAAPVCVQVDWGQDGEGLCGEGGARVAEAGEFDFLLEGQFGGEVAEW
jgi:hypothetical protein